MTKLRAVIPSHLHWDHASAPEYLTAQYVSDAIQWHFIELLDRPYLGFEQSLDVYGDGRVVLVSLSGHSPGQVGLFLTLDSGRQLFFIGDTSWTAEGVTRNKPRPVFVNWVTAVDWDKQKNQQRLAAINRLHLQYPAMVIVPAHDERVSAKLAHFPAFEY